MTGSVRVIEIDPRTDARWDAFVRSHPGAGPYHLGAWAEILRRAYGFAPHYLALEADGELEGVLPLVRSKGVVSGPRFRSLPFLNAAGPTARTPEGTKLLLEEACRLTDRNARLLTMRSSLPVLHELVPAVEQLPRPPNWVVELPEGEDVQISAWKKSAQHLYRNVTRAQKAGVTFREAPEAADLDRFYTLYLKVMRRHHTLPRSLRMLRLSRELLGPSGEYRLFAVEHEGRTIGSTVCYVLGDTVDLIYSASDDAARELRPNHALWWGVLKWSAEHGYRHLDLGFAIEGGPLSRFKRQFLAEPVGDYRYDYDLAGHAGKLDSLRDSSARLDHADEVTSRKDRLIATLWDHAPLRATQAAGSLVYRFV
jgi:CelD/BcsL family acetyltransferase involved in cellulose biosynthesis